jgi:hypothetical protein
VSKEEERGVETLSNDRMVNSRMMSSGMIQISDPTLTIALASGRNLSWLLGLKNRTMVSNTANAVCIR